MKLYLAGIHPPQIRGEELLGIGLGFGIARTLQDTPGGGDTRRVKRVQRGLALP